MIPAKQSRYRQIESSGEAMSIHMDEKSAHTLSSTIYSHHRREEAVLREIGCNAYDGHLKAGREAQPFKVTLPTEAHPHLIFRDFGIGMTHEEGQRYLTGFFRSGSQFEEAPTGYYGLGAKSPFAYTDTYDVTVIRDSRRSHFLFYKDESGTPTHSVIEQAVETDEPDGVIFRIPVNPKDIARFTRMAAYLFPLFRTFPDIDNMDVAEKKIAAQAFMARQEDFNGVPAILVADNDLPGFVSAHPSHGTVMLWMGNILYPLTTAQWLKSDVIGHGAYLSKLQQLAERSGVRIMIMADLKDGITVEPGRERIITSRRNIATIEHYAERLYKAVYRRGRRQYEGLTNWQIARQADDRDQLARTSSKPPADILALHLFCDFEFRLDAFTPLMEKFAVDISVVSIKPHELMHSSKALERYIKHRQQGIRPRAIHGVYLKNRRSTRVVDIVGDAMSELPGDGSAPARVSLEVMVVKARHREADLAGFAEAMFGEGEYREDDQLRQGAARQRQRVDQATRKNLTLWGYSKAGWAPGHRIASEKELVRRGVRAFGFTVHAFGPQQLLVMPQAEAERQRPLLEALHRHLLPFHLVTYKDDARTLSVGKPTVEALMAANPQVRTTLSVRWFRTLFLAAMDEHIVRLGGCLVDTEETRTLVAELVSQVRGARACRELVDAPLLEAFPERLGRCLVDTNINYSAAEWEALATPLQGTALMGSSEWSSVKEEAHSQAHAAGRFMQQVVALAREQPLLLMAAFRVDMTLMERFRRVAMASEPPSLYDQLKEVVHITSESDTATARAAEASLEAVS